jgi:hypothetical protein
MTEPINNRPPFYPMDLQGILTKLKRFKSGLADCLFFSFLVANGLSGNYTVLQGYIATEDNCGSYEMKRSWESWNRMII